MLKLQCQCAIGKASDREKDVDVQGDSLVLCMLTQVMRQPPACGTSQKIRLAKAKLPSATIFTSHKAFPGNREIGDTIATARLIRCQVQALEIPRHELQEAAWDFQVWWQIMLKNASKGLADALCKTGELWDDSLDAHTQCLMETNVLETNLQCGIACQYGVSSSDALLIRSTLWGGLSSLR